MNKIIVILIGLLSITGFSQQRSYHEDAFRYFELNGTTQQYDRALDQLFVMLQQQYATVQVPEATWSIVQEEIKTEAIQTIKSALVPVYQDHFSRKELRKMIDFYSTDTGKQIVINPQQLTEDQKKEASGFYNAPIGVKIQAKSEALKQGVSEASELWSRDVYTQTVQLLEAKGYVLPK